MNRRGALSLLLRAAAAAAIGATAAAAAAADGVQPLPGLGTEAGADAQHVLIGLSTSGRDPVWPEREAALPVADDDGLARRWQAELPAVLARQDPAAGAALLAALDRHCLAALARADGDRARLGIALDHLPAPSARTEVARAEGAAWDRGRLRAVVALDAADCHAVAAEPDGDGERSCSDPRAALAAEMLAGGAGADPLPLPGLPTPLPPAASASAPAAAVEPGLTVTWAACPGWLFGLDPAGRVAWQRSLPLAAEVAWGDGGAVVRSPTGLLAIDEDGAARALGPLPRRARLGGVAGAAAWFVLDTRAWRVALPGGQAVPGELGEEPLAPPLACAPTPNRPWRSLWLTARTVVWWPGDGPPQRLRHGLPAGPGWTLRQDPAGGAVIAAPDGRRWHLDGRARGDDALAAGQPGSLLGRVRLLTASGEPARALDLLTADAAVAATGDGRRAALAAHLALGPGHLRRAEPAVSALAVACAAEDPVLAAAVRYAQLDAADAAPDPHADGTAEATTAAEAGSVPATAGATASEAVSASDAAPAPASVAAGDPAALRARLLAAFESALAAARAAQPAALYSRRPAEILDDPAQWRQALSADALDQVVSAASATASAASAPPPVAAGWTWDLDHPTGWTEVHCRDAGGALRWRHRWPTDPTLPSRALARTGDGWLLVAEGQDRLLLLTAATGDLVLAAPLQGLTAPPDSIRVLSPGRLALLQPPGIDDRLLLLDAGGPAVEVDGLVPWAMASSHPLPAPAKGLAADAGTAVVTLGDGRTLRF